MKAAPRTVTVSPYGPRQVPMLRLRGGWLLTAGFPTGTRVLIAVEAGRLQVEALKSERVE